MKLCRILQLWIFLVAINCCVQAQVRQLAEIMPQFEGSVDGLKKWLVQNMNYPQEAIQKKEEGRVVVKFVIKEDGSISQPMVTRSVSPSLDAEAIRLVSQMPKWIPASQDGQPCSIEYTLPIRFKLPELSQNIDHASAPKREYQDEVHSNYSITKFSDIDDVFDFIRPSKIFNTRDGDLKLICEDSGNGEIMKMYFRDKLLSYVGWSDPANVANGDYARLAVRTDRYQVAFIIHLPDKDHAKPYMYFEPLGTSTDIGLATALRRGANINIPISNGWMKFEPMTNGTRASLSFEPRSTKPSPSIYFMK